MKFSQLAKIAALIATGKIDRLPALITRILATVPEFNSNRSKAQRDFIGPIKKRSQWWRDFEKLAALAVDGLPRFTINALGNGKLPFLAFSSLPGLGFCPGAGVCLKWCYSFRAWRYPSAFCRQAQNSILMQSASGRAAILADLDKRAAAIAKKSGLAVVDFRLYVDGDFLNSEMVAFWFAAIAARPNLAVYGYSKSWNELLEHAHGNGIMPANYLLNLSSGSVHTDATRNMIIQLAISRGDFIAVNIGRAVHSSDHGTRNHNRELRAAHFRNTGRKAFTCPGACGDCTPQGHACGSDRFRGIDIIIAVH